MKERITYVLGAGFSAPLGLPVMSNFLLKSKDLYFSSPDEYPHFQSVLQSIGNLSIAKNYYETDLSNIEEILSIIEMGTFLRGDQLKKEFFRYIIDVIKAYTPELKPYSEKMPGNWYDFIFGDHGIHSYYGLFVANLFGLEFFKKQVKDYDQNIREFHVEPTDESSYEYAIISLNYDLVLEQICSFLNENYITKNKIEFSQVEISENYIVPPLCKLHGSVETGLIIPPTWSKGNHSEITPIWKNAYQVLKDSNYIRFIGYSLPVADSYVKYLLKSAVVHSKHLKNIDVICIDNDGRVKSRYDEFIKFGYYRFKNASVSDYLNEIQSSFKQRARKNIGKRGNRFLMNDLERIHNSFMEHNQNL